MAGQIVCNSKPEGDIHPVAPAGEAAAPEMGDADADPLHLPQLVQARQQGQGDGGNNQSEDQFSYKKLSWFSDAVCKN